MKEKIALLNLSEAEIAKLPKFMASLAFVTADEIKETQVFLKTMDIIITTAHQATILTNPLEELKRKISILEEVHVSNIYVQNPLMLNKNAIEIYKKVNYCIQNNIAYKKEDGTYEPFLFSEREWQKRFNQESELVTSVENSELEQTLVTLEPVVEPTEPTVIPFEPLSSEMAELSLETEGEVQEVIPFAPKAEEIYPDSMDIKEFIAKDVEEAPTMSFASLESSVNKMHSEIEDFEPNLSGIREAKRDLLNVARNSIYSNYKSSIASKLSDEYIGINDIGPEVYENGISRGGEAA